MDRQKNVVTLPVVRVERHSERDEIARRCDQFMAGAEKLYKDGPMKGDMWLFELFHHLRDCAGALRGAPTEEAAPGSGRAPNETHGRCLHCGDYEDECQCDGQARGILRTEQ